MNFGKARCALSDCVHGCYVNNPKSKGLYTHTAPLGLKLGNVDKQPLIVIITFQVTITTICRVKKSMFKNNKMTPIGFY